MCQKYYISNNIHFIQGYGNLMETPASATHFKQAEAKQYVMTHPDHVMMQYGNGNKKRNWVISTKQNFLANTGPAITTVKNLAKVFRTAEEAFEYIDNNSLTELFGDEIFVIDDNFRKERRKTAVQKPAEIQSKVGEEISERCAFSKKIRDEVRQKTNICPICGEPLTDDDFTIDHEIPLSRRGTNDMINLRPTHSVCNHMKGDMLDKEMFSKMSTIIGKNVFENPGDENGMKIIRAYVRGLINNSNILQ